MVAEIVEGQLVIRRTVREALPIDSSREPRIAAVGAGGKTTLLKTLAEEYKAVGRQSVIITTTHMKNEALSQFVVNPFIEEILKVKEREGYVVAGTKAENGKIKMLPEEILAAVLSLPCPVLIEADGARCLPVKIPAEHEPVLLPETTCVLSIYGLDAIGRKIREICFRAERAAKFLHKDVEDKLEAGDIAMLALSCHGGRKGVSDDMRYVIVLNKADTEDKKLLAVNIGEEIEKKRKESGLQKMKVIVTAR